MSHKHVSKTCSYRRCRLLLIPWFFSQVRIQSCSRVVSYLTLLIFVLSDRQSAGSPGLDMSVHGPPQLHWPGEAPQVTQLFEYRKQFRTTAHDGLRDANRKQMEAHYSQYDRQSRKEIHSQLCGGWGQWATAARHVWPSPTIAARNIPPIALNFKTLSLVPVDL